MPGEKPLLWKVFDAAEGAVAPRLEEALRTGAFAQALGLATRGNARARRAVERQSRRALHLVNLPAASDVAHLRRQLAMLDREVRRLTVALDRAMEEREAKGDGDADAAGGPGRRPTARSH